jgi:hypothetical protein
MLYGYRLFEGDRIRRNPERKRRKTRTSAAQGRSGLPTIFLRLLPSESGTHVLVTRGGEMHEPVAQAAWHGFRCRFGEMIGLDRAAASCSNSFQRWVRDRSTRPTSALRRRPSRLPSRVTSSRPPAPPPTTTTRCRVDCAPMTRRLGTLRTSFAACRSVVS